MYTLMVVVFVLGYLAIAFEHSIHIDKAASALITGVLCWTLYVLGMYDIVDMTSIDSWFIAQNPGDDQSVIAHWVTHHQLLDHLSEISSILFFLIGAMTIVELIDLNGGFNIITDKITSTNKVKLIWIIALLTFFLSAALDNLTSSIVMVSLLRKLIGDKQDRWFFAGIVVVAANAGGAWSPIGDVTTTMLWIGGQVTAVAIIAKVIVPSLVCLLVPLGIISFRLKGDVTRPTNTQVSAHGAEISTKERNLIFFVGIAGLLFVPIFKTTTHLPPFMGMMLSLGILWLVTERIHKKKDYEIKRNITVMGALRRIDMASVLFFLGILLAVSSLQSAGQLGELAMGLDNSLGTSDANGVLIVSLIIGLLSAIVDNVPLVAAAMGMYPIAEAGFFATDGLFWEFLAYCAGTGGSALIIGSAAGVAVMGIERIDFMWYLKKISVLALIGYFAGAGAYIAQSIILHY